MIRRCALAAVLIWTCRGQETQRKGVEIQTRSVEIIVPFTPVDAQDRILTDLRQQDIVVLDNGAPRPVTSMVLEDGPASVLFLLDVSASMRKAMPFVTEAVEQTVRHAADGDEFGVIEFGDRADMSVRFTATASDVNRRLRDLTPFGRTSLVDATIMALQQIKSAHHSRRAIVIITDGQDNNSRYKERDALRAAMETDVRVYGIELSPPFGESFTGKTFVESLAETTGGRYLPTLTNKSIPGLVARIDVHRFYRATFTPESADTTGKPHRIDMKLTRKDALKGGRLFWRRLYSNALE